MRLINTATLEFEEYFGSRIPKYAILSHAWGKEEISFQDWADGRGLTANAGCRKILLACDQAKKDRLKYLWVDTNCIDKSSSAELAEAVNSMFAWYRDSVICYAYLEDYPQQNFITSRWFTRGWTLQELLAPREVVFFSKNWTQLGCRKDRLEEISEITGIEKGYLDGSSQLNSASVACRMSWVSRRTTTRIEDMAYCMLGIFDINIPLLYGEGSKAFIRLQEEIIRVSNDQSIFCWTWNDDVPQGWVSMLAPSPSTFSDSADYWDVRQGGNNKPLSYSITNAGLHIRLPIVRTWSYYIAILSVQRSDRCRAGIPLKGSLGNGVLERLSFPNSPVDFSEFGSREPEYELYIPITSIGRYTEYFNPLPNPNQCGMLVFFNNIEHLVNFRSYPARRFNPLTSLFLFDRDEAISGGILRFERSDSEDFMVFFGASRKVIGHTGNTGARIHWFARSMHTRCLKLSDIMLAKALDHMKRCVVIGRGLCNDCIENGCYERASTDVALTLFHRAPIPFNESIGAVRISLIQNDNSEHYRISKESA